MYFYEDEKEVYGYEEEYKEFWDDNLKDYYFGDDLKEYQEMWVFEIKHRISALDHNDIRRDIDEGAIRTFVEQNITEILQQDIDLYFLLDNWYSYARDYLSLGTKEVFDPIKQSSLIIKNIEFVDTIPNLDDVQNKWDVSYLQNNSIMAWLDNDTLKISGNGKIFANKHCHFLFSGRNNAFNNIESINFNDLLDTSLMDLSSFMFYGCEKLKKVEVSNWNTENLQDTEGMFEGCEILENIELSKWNTRSLKNASGMFENCYNLKKIDVSNWNTQKLEDTSFMFLFCDDLEEIDISKWNTQNLQKVRKMFACCGKLKNIDVLNWNTQKLEDTYKMFLGCDRLIEIITDDDNIIEEFENCIKERQEQQDNIYFL